MTLRKGDKGQEVMLLQAALQDGGFRLPQYGVDGIFGTETESAVMQTQQHFLMEPTGIAGQNLFNALGIENITSPPLQNINKSTPSVKQWILAGIVVGAVAFAAQKMRG